MTTVLTTPVTVFFVVVGAFVVGVVVGVGVGAVVVGAVVVGVVVGAGEVGVFVVPAPAPSLPDLVTGTFGVLGVVGAVVDPPPDEPLESPLPDCEPEPLGFALVFDFVFLTYLFC